MGNAMRGTEGKLGERPRRHGWKAVGVTLLGLMGGALGCQATGDSPTHAVLDPVAAANRQGRYALRTASAITPSSSLAEDVQPAAQARGTPPEAPASIPGVGAIQTAFHGNPDSARPEDKEGVRLAGVPSQLPLGNPTAVPPTDKVLRGDKEKKSDRGTAGNDRAYQVDRTLPSPLAGMSTPVIPEPEKFRPITLGASLALAGVENPVIGIANQAVQISLAEQLRARVLLLPNVNVGANYHLHNGPLQSSFGAIRKNDSQLINYGLGTNAVTAGTQEIPGLFISTPLANAIFEPRVAGYLVANRRFAATATRNQILLEVSTAYLNLLRTEGRLAVIRQSEADFAEVVRLTANFAQTGQGRQGDADRARADLLSLQYKEQFAQEEVAVASAELARLLNQDPSTRLQTGDVPIQVVQFVDPKEPLPKLLDIAARNRPEVLAAAAMISASNVRVRQEKTRPLLPLLVAGFSADDFGGGAVASTNGNVFNPNGPNPGGAATTASGGRTVPSFGRITGRTDVDVLALWTLQNMGFGNVAHVRERRAELRQAEAERVRVLNQVEKEVSVAYNLSAEHWRAMLAERRRVQEASNGFQHDLERIRGGIGFPIEVLNNAHRLSEARRALLEELIGFDRSQFQLFVALGQPPTLVVDDDRPIP